MSWRPANQKLTNPAVRHALETLFGGSDFSKKTKMPRKAVIPIHTIIGKRYYMDRDALFLFSFDPHESQKHIHRPVAPVKTSLCDAPRITTPHLPTSPPRPSPPSIL